MAITAGRVNFTKKVKVLTGVLLEPSFLPSFLTRGPPLSLTYPPHFVDAVTYERELLCFRNVDLFIMIYLQFVVFKYFA
jgi:hypothetical protein